MIRFVRQYHDRDDDDVAHVSGRLISYDNERLPETVRRFMEQAKNVVNK